MNQSKQSSVERHSTQGKHSRHSAMLPAELSATRDSRGATVASGHHLSGPKPTAYAPSKQQALPIKRMPPSQVRPALNEAVASNGGREASLDFHEEAFAVPQHLNQLGSLD